MTFRILLPAALVALTAVSGAPEAAAQSLHVRMDAPPRVKAKIARTISHARVLAASRGGVDLTRTFLSECGELDLGESAAASPSKIRSRVRETPTVVNGSVINICR
ncbi:MAG: hypothetical protein AAF074_05740 [Pseudomonadota bacterium]